MVNQVDRSIRYAIASTLGLVALGYSAIGIFAVEGEWETALEIECLGDCLQERARLTAALESELNVVVEWEDLDLWLESLWGWYGLAYTAFGADVDVSASTIESAVTLAAPFGDGQRIAPGRLLPVRGRVTLVRDHEGLGVEVGILQDDLDFPSTYSSPSGRYASEDQRFGMGSRVHLEGETSSHTELSWETGFCFDPGARFSLMGTSLSGEVCNSGDLQWTQTTLEVTDIHWLAGLTNDNDLECESVDASPEFVCDFETEWTAIELYGPLEEARLTLDYDTIYPDRELDDIEIEIVTTSAEWAWTFDRDLDWDHLNVDAERSVHRGQVVWSGDLYLTFEPEVGFTYLRLGGALERGDHELGVDITFDDVDDAFRFDELEATGEFVIGGFALESGMTVERDGLDEIEISSTLEF